MLITFPDDAYAIIDTKIREHETALLSLKHARNALAPISELPSEVLSIIFKQVKYDYDAEAKDKEDDDDNDEGGVPFHLGWVKVSAVCRHWREISLNTLSLWTDVDFSFGDLDYISELLTRSKTAPIDLFVSFADTPTDDYDLDRHWTLAVDAVSTRTLKCLTIHTGTDSTSVTRLLAAHGNRPCLLRNFGLHSRGWSGPALDLPFTSMPVLQILEVSGIPLPVTFPAFPNLGGRSLHPPTDSPIPISHVLQILRNAPRLLLVSIYEICEDIDVNAISNLPLVKLPKLESIVLAFNTLDATRLLDHLSFPGDSTSVSLSLNVSQVDATLSSTGLTHIQPLWSRFTRALPESELHASIWPYHNAPILTISLYKSTPSQEPLDFTLTVPSDFPFQILTPFFGSVTSLKVAGFRDEQQWCSYLPSFANLKKLTVKHYNLSILEVITPSSQPSHGEAGDAMELELALPKLDTLILSGYVFGDGEKDCRFALSTDSKPLSALLRSRNIPTVQIIRSVVTRDFFNQFQSGSIGMNNVDWGNTRVCEYVHLEYHDDWKYFSPSDYAYDV